MNTAANLRKRISERTGDIKKVGAEGRPEVIVKSLGAPHQLALIKHAGKRLLYAACYDSGELVRLDVDAKTVTTVAGGLGHPVGLVVDAPQKWAYVTEQDKSSLTRVKLADGTATVLYTGLVQPFFLAWDQVAKGIFCVQRDPSNSLGVGEPGCWGQTNRRVGSEYTTARRPGARQMAASLSAGVPALAGHGSHLQWRERQPAKVGTPTGPPGAGRWPPEEKPLLRRREQEVLEDRRERTGHRSLGYLRVVAGGPSGGVTLPRATCCRRPCTRTRTGRRRSRG